MSLESARSDQSEHEAHQCQRQQVERLHSGGVSCVSGRQRRNDGLGEAHARSGRPDRGERCLRCVNERRVRQPRSEAVLG